MLGMQLPEELPSRPSTSLSGSSVRWPPTAPSPLHNATISKAEMEEIKTRYEAIYARCAQTPSWFIHEADPRPTLSVPPEEREAFWEETVCGTGVWHLDGQFPGHPDG